MLIYDIFFNANSTIHRDTKKALNEFAFFSPGGEIRTENKLGKITAELVQIIHTMYLGNLFKLSFLPFLPLRLLLVVKGNGCVPGLLSGDVGGVIDLLHLEALLPATVTGTPDIPHLYVENLYNPRWHLLIICFDPGIVLAVLIY